MGKFSVPTKYADEGSDIGTFQPELPGVQPRIIFRVACA